MKLKHFFPLLAGISLGASVSAASVENDMPYLTLSDGSRIPQLGCGVWELNGQEAYKSVTESIK